MGNKREKERRLSEKCFLFLSNRSAGTDVIRLERENKHLMNVVENLRTSTPDNRARQLVEENRSLSENMLEYKTTISKLTKVGVIIGAAVVAIIVTIAVIMSA